MNRQRIRRKIWMMMRLTILLLLVSTMTISAKSYSQKVNITATDVSVENVLRQIREQTGSSILWGDQALKNLPAISVSLKDADLKQALDGTLKTLPLSYTLYGNVVYVERKENSEVQEPPIDLPGAIEVGGQVKNNAGDPIPGVTVRIKNTNQGTLTDANGYFTIDADLRDTLIFSFLSYESQEFIVTGISEINIVLKASERSMDEIVVVGMSNKQTQRSVTGSIATIQTKELKQSPVANLSNALAGRLPGLITVQSSGQPGNDAARLFIRGQGTYGNTEPLVVIDGLPRGLGDFNQIDPNEVESITILKDAASSALYGIQGANGVVVVTTRRGGANRKPQIELTAQQAFQEPILLPKNMETYDLALYKNEYAKNTGLPPDFDEEALEAVKTHTKLYLYPDVDWFDYILRDFTPQKQYNLNVSGSTDKVRYFVSGSYLNQNSLLRYQEIFKENYGVKSGFNRYNFRSNVDIDVTKMLHLKVDLAGRLEDRTGPAPGESSVFSDLTNMDAFNNPVFNPNGTLGGASNISIGYYKNPLGQVTKSGYYQEFNNVMTGTLSAKHDFDFITPGLSAEVNFSFESQNLRRTTRSQDFDSYWYRGLDLFGDSVYQTHTIGSRLSTSGASNIERSTYLDVRVNYDKIINDLHKVRIQGLGTRTLRRVNDELPFAYQGVSGHATYSFKNRYFLEGDIGYNGSENFPKGKRYGIFPAVSAGWILSDESFIASESFLSFLKIRGSYGVVGNDKIGGDRWLFISDFDKGNSIGFGETPSYAAGIVENRVGNQFVTWEKAEKANLGFELSLFKDNNVQLTFDIFREKRRDILTAPNSVPSYDGIVNLAPRNSGKVLNKGYDFELRLNKNIGTDINVFATFQLTYAKNKVLENDEPLPQEPYQELRGYPIGTVLGYRALGYFQDDKDIEDSPDQGAGIIPGDIKYEDINGDELVDAFDRIPIRLENVPTFVGGLSFGGSYKWVDFSLLFNGAKGGTSQYIAPASRAEINKLYWTPELGNQAMVPVPHRSANNALTSTFWIQNTDYLKLRNAEVGFTLPSSWLEPVKIQYARLYVNGQNLLLWDRLWVKDRDPESSSRSGSLPYPIQRVFNVGLNVRF